MTTVQDEGNAPGAAELARLALDAMQSGRPLPDDVQAWLRGGLRDYLDRGGSLDAHLGLRAGTPGRYARPTERERLRRVRARLQGALEAEAQDLTPTAAAKLLAELLQGKRLPETSAGAVNVNEARRDGAPRSARQIYRLIAAPARAGDGGAAEAAATLSEALRHWSAP